MSRDGRVAVVSIVMLFFAITVLRAHSGPPFPIVSSQVAGPYSVSVWTDPDSTDDGSAAGRFWVTLHPVDGKVSLPAATNVTVLVEPVDGPSAQRSESAQPIDADPTRRLAAVVMDHEGRFRVHVTITGPLGPAFVDSEVDATYDERPPPAMIAVFLLPFLLVGFLWIKLMVRRRRR